jgi:cytochrome c-type protein NapB
VRRSLTPSQRRGANLLIVAAVATAVVGFFTGMHGTPEPVGYRSAGTDPVSSAKPAPKQRDMESMRYADRRAAQSLALVALGRPERGVNDPVALDASAYAADVAKRALGRAYDGAPPTIPHAVDQSGAPACLACHAEGLTVEGKLARPISHEPYPHCLQCHTAREGPPPRFERLPPSVSEESAFVGLRSPGPGARAWAGAPPQMPHRSFMRERCAACHGVHSEGVASSHPARQSCTQCHTPAASFDQVPRSTFAPLGQIDGRAP